MGKDHSGKRRVAGGLGAVLLLVVTVPELLLPVGGRLLKFLGIVTAPDNAATLVKWMTGHELLVQGPAIAATALGLSYAFFGPWWLWFARYNDRREAAGLPRRKLDPSHLIWTGCIGAVCFALMAVVGVIWQQSRPAPDSAELIAAQRQLAETREALRKTQEPSPTAKPEQAQPTPPPKPPRAPLPDPRKYYDAETKQALRDALKIMKTRLEDVEPTLAPLVLWDRPPRHHPPPPRDNPDAIYAKLQAALEAVGQVIVMPRDENYKEIALELAYVVNFEKYARPFETLREANQKVSVFYSLGHFDKPARQNPDLERETLAEAMNEKVAPVGAAAGELRTWAIETREHIEDMRRALSL